MSTFAVSNDAQLRQAILDAADGDTIRFGSDITLAADLPAIQTDVTIEGRPARRVSTPFYDPEGRRARG